MVVILLEGQYNELEKCKGGHLYSININESINSFTAVDMTNY